MSDSTRSTFSICKVYCGMVLLFAGLFAALPLSAQTDGRMQLNLAAPLPAHMIYWFVRENQQTEPKPLPAAPNGGLIALDVPRTYTLPDSQIAIADVERHRIARLPVVLMQGGGSTRPSESAILFSSLWSYSGENNADRVEVAKRLGLWANHVNALKAARKSYPDGRTSQNLLRNFDFRDGMNDWTVENAHPPAFVETKVLDNPGLPSGVPGKAIRCNVTAAGTETWHAQVLQTAVDLAAGAPYTASFWARADRPRNIDLASNLDKPDYRPLGLFQHFALTTEWKRYVCGFMPMHVLPKHGRISFCVSETTGTIDIAGVTLRSGVDPAILGAGKISTPNLAAADFIYAQSIRVPVAQHGRPVAEAHVTLRDENNNVLGQYYLQAGDNGTARFSDVPLNNNLKVSVSIGALTAGFTRIVPEDKPDTVESIDLPANWKDVKTLTPPPPPVAASVLPAEEPAQSSSNNGLLWISLGAIVLLAGGIGVYLVSHRSQPQPQNTGMVAQSLAPKQTMFNTPPLRFPESQPVGARSGNVLPEALPEQADPSAQMVAIAGKYAGTTFRVERNIIEIGRDKTCDIPLPLDSSTSRRHATLQQSINGPEIVDHNSSNGTYLNGVRLASDVPHAVRPGDEIEIGASRFRYES